MIFGFAFVWSLATARADDAAFAREIVTEIQREHRPWRGAPIVIVNAHPTGCSGLLGILARDLDAIRPTLTIDASGFKDTSDIWALRGPDVGYVGADSPTKLERFLRAHPAGTILFASDGHLKGEVTLAPWLWQTLTSGVFPSPRGDVPINDVTFVIEMYPGIEVAPKLAVRSLIQSAEASGANGPTHFHVLRRFMAQAKLRTAATP